MRHNKLTNRYTIFLFIVMLFMSTGCNSREDASSKGGHITKAAADTPQHADSKPSAVAASASPDASYHGKEVPILCYHQIRDWKETDSKSSRVYIMPEAKFREQIKALHDSGYSTILPDQLIAYLTKGEPLPRKPIMLTFDDATISHHDVVLPELDKYGYKAAFFIMTVVLNRPHYLSRDQVKEISDKGHLIACHTWDHHNVSKYTDKDWPVQVEKPVALLEKLTGKPVKYFAYPFGLWNKPAAEKLKSYGFTAAFQLAAKQDADLPLYTIRRIIVDPNWNTAQFLNAIKKDFK